MKGDQKTPPPGSVVRTHEWKPKHSAGYDEAKKAVRVMPPRQPKGKK
jgi:hypothetical protein